MTTIPLPIPVPTINVEGDKVTIDSTATKSAISQRKRGVVLTFDEEYSSPICCACKEFRANQSLLEPPAGYRYGGWFCGYCLGQGEIAKSLGLVIDQIICEIVQDE